MIDLKKLHDLFGDKLPSLEQFRANNDGHDITMLAIRKHVGVRGTKDFPKAWEAFVVAYNEYVKSLKPKAVPKKEVTKKVEPVAEAKADDQADD